MHTSQAIHLQWRDTTQDTCPVCELLQGQGVRLELIRSPSLRQTNKKAAPRGGLFICLPESMGAENPNGFDGFARSESGQPNGWPWSARARKGWVHGCTQQSQ